MFLLLLIFPFLFLILKPTSKSKSQIHPPSPASLPFIGHLHLLLPIPYRALHSLSLIHGPIMLLQLGQIPTLILSSSSAVRSMTKSHDIAFSSRPNLKVPRQLVYNSKNISFSPYGPYWRQSRKLSVLHLLSTKRVLSFRPIQNSELSIMLSHISNHSPSGPINLSETINFFTTNILCKVALGRSIIEESQCRMLHDSVCQATKLIGSFNIDDYFPSLKWLNMFSSLDSKIAEIFKNLDGFITSVIDDHLVAGVRDKDDDNADLVDILLSLQRDPLSGEFSPTTDEVKAIILNMFAAGTTTSYIFLEWAMSELIRNPKVMNKLKEEAKLASEKSSMVVEENVNKMSYLKAVVKEVLRLHPPIPLLLPRETIENTELQGYKIPAKTRVLINGWAIGRDPKFWNAPKEFIPERFVNNELDFRGQDFEFIPFGVGRRICPGMHFAVATIEFALANLVHQFDWEMPNGLSAEDLNMDEAQGLIMHRKHPLVLVAKKVN
ncbi:cytochrome P450 736A117-like [Dioscorea cayenensis subsp. rotundata]|uniref:Cytochrome P450 736A117-like n=1 Tax=Dioscorea cayennensis subsp. rotundata TaxID=55577 RepID=A0AB40C0P5_DIOCR|nr:cytochrome P450 736A117-like [Dioscorea cayenensis subsp. rotundata]